MFRKVRTSWKDVPNPPEAMYTITGDYAWELGYKAAIRAYEDFHAPVAEPGPKHESAKLENQQFESVPVLQS